MKLDSLFLAALLFPSGLVALSSPLKPKPKDAGRRELPEGFNRPNPSPNVQTVTPVRFTAKPAPNPQIPPQQRQPIFKLQPEADPFQVLPAEFNTGNQYIKYTHLPISAQNPGYNIDVVGRNYYYRLYTNVRLTNQKWIMLYLSTANPPLDEREEYSIQTSEYTTSVERKWWMSNFTYKGLDEQTEEPEDNDVFVMDQLSGENDDEYDDDDDDDDVSPSSTRSLHATRTHSSTHSPTSTSSGSSGGSSSGVYSSAMSVSPYMCTVAGGLAAVILYAMI